MSGRNKKTLHDQLVTCNRRLEGHLQNDNSNGDRYFRLLMRQAELESQIFISERGRYSRSRRTSSKQSKSSSSDS